MTRNSRKKWQEQKRPWDKKTVGYSIDGDSFTMNSVERIGGIFIQIDKTDVKSVKSHFTVYFKSGKELKIERDITAKYKLETKKSWFGIKSVKVYYEHQEYFDEYLDETIANIRKKIKSALLESLS